VPASLIEQEDCVCSWSDLGGNLVEMQLHGLAVAGWQHQRSAGPEFGADCTKQVGGLGPLIVRGARAWALPGPPIGELVLRADPHLVLAPDLYRSVGRKLRADLCHAGGKVFLNACTASGSCL